MSASWIMLCRCTGTSSSCENMLALELAGHVFVQGEARTGGQSRGVAVVVHHRLAQEVEEWVGGPCPYVSMRLDDGSVTYLCVYLRHAGHHQEVWAQARAGYTTTLQPLVLGGNFNTAAVGRTGGEQETARESERAQDIHDMLHRPL